MSDDLLFTNFTFDPDCYYFLYLGDLKGYGLNELLRETLSRRLQRRVEFIAIVPDIMAQYNYRNILVVNPLVGRDGAGRMVSRRPPSGVFMRAVSTGREVARLVERILENQEHLYLSLWESKPELTLDERPEVSILGPDKAVADRVNNKIFQYETLKEVVPVVDFRVCRGRDELLDMTRALRPRWREGIFVSRAYSAAGIGSAITHTPSDVEQFCHGCADGEPYLISPYLPHEHDPTVLGVVANERQVFIAGVADQVIVDGNRFVGSTYPSVLSEEIRQRLRELTRKTGRILGGCGYRGIFGCDYLIDRDGEIRFLEVNARKQGTTLEFCYTLEQILPPGAPLLPELEYCAVVENRFPDSVVEPAREGDELHWGTYNDKIMQDIETRGYIPQTNRERRMFAAVAGTGLEKDYVIIEHIGSGQAAAAGVFLARAVSVAKNRAGMRDGLKSAQRCIRGTIG